MQKSFFSRFKDKLDADYGGRYFEVILQEVISEEPEVSKLILGDIQFTKNDEVEVIIESKFIEGRRADISLRVNGIEKGLIEIKYEDQALNGQIETYLKYVTKKDIAFTYLTLHQPKKEELKKITSCSKKNIMHMRYSDLYNELEKKKFKNPVVMMFSKYLKENYMAYDHKFLNENTETLTFIMLKGLFVKHKHGFGRKVTDKNITTIPDYWGTLITNVRYLGDRFYDEHFDYFNNRPSVDYKLQPKFDMSKIEKKIEDYGNYDEIDRDDRVGGWFDIWFSSRLKINEKNHYVYIRSGISHYLDLENKKINLYVYSRVSGKDFHEPIEYRKSISKWGDVDRMYKLICSRIIKSVEKALKDNSFDKKTNAKKQMNSILRNLRIHS